MTQINLWNVYYMTTNAKKDVWVKKDFLNGKIEKDKIGCKKYRFTFPIQKLRILNSGEIIYLVCQINTKNTFPLKTLEIPSSLKKNSKISGYILPINIRMATKKEFLILKNQKLYVRKEERWKFYKKVWDKLNNDPWLSWRLKKIQATMKGKYDNLDSERLNKLISYLQFNFVELKQKGNLKLRKYQENIF